MPKASKKPLAEDLYDEATELIAANAPRNSLFARLESLYDQSRGTKAAAEQDNVVLVQMPYATNTIDLVTDLAGAMTFSIEVPANKETAQAKRAADDIEQWLRAWHSLQERRRGGQSFTQDLAWHAAMRSVCVLRTLFLEQQVTEREDGSFVANVPVLLQTRDPRYLYWEEDADSLLSVVEEWERSVGSIRQRYPGVLKDQDDDTFVTWREYWDDTFRVYWANGEPVKIKGLGSAVVPHGYGCVPYAFGTARSTPRVAAEQRYRPLLAATEALLKDIDVWFSILTTAGHDSVTNAWAVFSDDPAKKLDLSPDAVNYFSPADKLQPLQRAPLPADFFQLGQHFLTALQEGTFPFAMFGQGQGQVAGYAINMLTQSGRRPLVPIWNAIERCYEAAFANCLTICREKVAPLVGDKIPLMIAPKETGEAGRRIRRELKLDTTQIGPDFDVYVQLSDPMPQDEAANLRMALEAVKGGLLSQQTALEKFKLATDALAEMDRINVEQIVRQLAPVEAAKLAVKRGYVPATGWHFGQDGRIVPDVMEQSQPQPQPTIPTMPQPQPQPQTQQQMPNPAELQAMFGQTMPPPEGQAAGMPPIIGTPPQAQGV
jgi:hypothetical protein